MGEKRLISQSASMESPNCRHVVEELGKEGGSSFGIASVDAAATDPVVLMAGSRTPKFLE